MSGDKEKQYLVSYRFINTGEKQHDVIRVSPDDKREIREIIEDRWRGLTCDTGGLRNIVSIKELVD